MINKSILMGRLTRDPELKKTPSGKSVTSFTLAVTRNIKSQSGTYESDFIDIVAWGHDAEFAVKYFRKGQLVAVVGRIQIRKWTDRENKPRVSFEIVADELHFAEAKRDNPAPQQPPAAPPDFGDFGEPEDYGDELPDSFR